MRRKALKCSNANDRGENRTKGGGSVTTMGGAVMTELPFAEALALILVTCKLEKECNSKRFLSRSL